MNSESEIPPVDPPESNQIPEPTFMEVHHHAHPHEKRSWPGYLREFLMLFLAVFCGFLAEYQLEHVIEHQREKTLMKRLTEDLRADERILMTYAGWRSEVGQDFDSLLLWLASPDPDQHAFSIYQKISRSAMRFGLPDINEGTIQQLKNAGGLRLVRKQEVVSAINKHYLQVGRMRSAYETERLVRVRLADTGAELIDARLAMDLQQNPASFRLMTKDEPTLNRYMNQILTARSINNILINNLDSARVSSARLKELIEVQYH